MNAILYAFKSNYIQFDLYKYASTVIKTLTIESSFDFNVTLRFSANLGSVYSINTRIGSVL